MQSQKFPLRSIMVIDDSPLDQYVIRMLLTNTRLAGEIIICNSGKEALEYLDTVQSGDSTPQLLLLDLYMLEVDGFAFLSLLMRLPKKFLTEIPVVILSSSIEPHDFSRTVIYPNVRLYLHKPFTIEKIEKIKSTFMNE